MFDFKESLQIKMVKANSKLKLTEQKRQDILEGAISEFFEKGFSGTNMELISKKAQVSKRTLYNHFPSKEALFEVIVKNLMDRSSQVAEFSYDPKSSLEEQLMVISFQFSEMLTHVDFLKLTRVVFSRLILKPDAIGAMIKEQEKFHSGLIQWIKKVNKDKRLLIVKPEQAARQFLDLITGLVFWPQLLENKKALAKKELHEELLSITKMFLKSYAQ